MNPKKRLKRILSALLALVLLLSLAFAAFAEEQPEVDPELIDGVGIDGVPIDGGENGGSEIDQTPHTSPGTNVEIDYPPSPPALSRMMILRATSEDRAVSETILFTSLTIKFL